MNIKSRRLVSGTLMYKPLSLALLLTLGACSNGNSVNTGPASITPPILDPPPPPVVEKPDPLFGFDDISELEFWGVQVWGGTVTAELSLHTSSENTNYGALQINPAWADSDGDKLVVISTLPEPMDLSNSSMTFDIYLPEAYTEEGTMGLQVFLEDSAGNKGGIQINGSSWLNMDTFKTGDTRTSYKDPTILSFPALKLIEEWDGSPLIMTDITGIGVQFVSNGKDYKTGIVYEEDGVTEIGHEYIFFDNMTIITEEEAPPPPQFVIDFADESDVATFSVSTQTGSGTAELSYGNETMVITPTWLDTTDLFVVNRTGLSSFNIERQNISFDVYTPAAYITDTNLGLQFFFRDAAGLYGQAGWTSTSSLKADDWATVTFTDLRWPGTIDEDDLGNIGYTNEGFDMGNIVEIGIEVHANGKATDITGPIQIDNITLPASLGGGVQTAE